MYAVVNGLDDVSYGGQNVHNDNPGEQIVEIGMGKSYGYPYCFTAQRIVKGGAVVPPGTQLQFGTVHDDAWCAANSLPPSTFIQAHSAPLDLTFFDDQPRGALPDKYRGGAFVALHGSWDRSPATGYKVIWVPFDASGKSPMPTSTATDTTFPYEVILGGGDATGAKDGAWSWSTADYADQPRFAGVAISPVDGALYVTSDSGGYIYRLGVPN
jgi:glucose/arabinose dehydrogenase